MGCLYLFLISTSVDILLALVRVGCGAGSMKRFDVRPSVCPYVCPSMGYSRKLRCCDRAGRRYRSIAARRTAAARRAAGSATLSAYVVAQHRLVTIDTLRYLQQVRPATITRSWVQFTKPNQPNPCLMTAADFVLTGKYA